MGQVDTMYRVQGTMRDNYYADEEPPRRTNLVSVGVDCNSSSQEEVLMNNAGLITLLGCVKVIQINLGWCLDVLYSVLVTKFQ